MKPLVLISPWFGPWPAWINLYLVSCTANPEVRWLIPTDQEPPACQPQNVHFLAMSFATFCDRVSDAIGLRFAPPSAYKVCDIRPMLGHVFAGEIEGYQSWGFADHDVIWGDLRRTYTDELLRSYNAISNHADRISGHLAIFANTERLRLAYQRRKGHWQRAVTSSEPCGFDEGQFDNVFRPRGFFQKPFALRPSLYVERHSTADSGRPWVDGRRDRDPHTWVWRAGNLTNTDNGDTDFPYLHFMMWRSGTYRPARLGPAPWTTLRTPLVQVEWQRAAEEGFIISTEGFLPLDAAIEPIA